MRPRFALIVFFVCGCKPSISQTEVVTKPPTQAVAKPPAGDLAIPYYDRDKVDITNLRDFFNGLLIADIMMHADAMFASETKWKMTLHQMILLGSNHHQARAAKQLSLMGVSLDDVRAIWSPDYVERIRDPRIKAAFEYIDAVVTQPGFVTADTHAALRMHFIDRQIAELFELTSINAAMATHDLLLPIPTDQATIEWAEKHLASVGWSLGRNAASSPSEQRATLFVGKALKTAYDEIIADWHPGDLSKPNPAFKTDWINVMTGYDISPVTFDRDKDGVEDPFDSYPDDYARWKGPDLNTENLPPAETPPFNVEAYDYDFYQPSVVPKTKYPASDRLNFDSEWVRQSSIGTVAFDKYQTASDRAFDMATKWHFFFVAQLSSGCGHCQVHGAYGIYDATKSEYPYSKLPAELRPDLINRIHALMDFERTDRFSAAEKAAFRFCRDGGALPTRTTAAHIEELRRHYSNREIQELTSIVVMTSWLASSMQSQITVTDRLSMSWALRNLTSAGWKPGPHLGAPDEQRPYHMGEIIAVGMAKMNSGEVMDAQSEWLDEDVPLAVDSDRDGVEDGFDGFPNDPTRWEDTDRDGIEDSSDEDIDGDGIPNQEEVDGGTFPYKADSDGDGVDDAAELKNGTNPIDPRDL